MIRLPNSEFREMPAQCGLSTWEKELILKLNLSRLELLQVNVYVADHHLNINDEHDFIASVSEITNHPNYNSNTQDNDFAILTLSEELTFTDKVSPVCMPDVSRTYYDLDAVVSGWGTTTQVCNKWSIYLKNLFKRKLSFSGWANFPNLTRGWRENQWLSVQLNCQCCHSKHDLCH